MLRIEVFYHELHESGTDLGFVSAFNRLVSSARGSCSRRVIGLLMSLCFVLEMTIVWRAALGVLVPGALMRPFVSLSCSREDDRLASKRLVFGLVPKCCRAGNRSQL